MTNKLLAEWFWTDRWMGSSAFLLPLEPRGLYREMLTQAWLRRARLPNDHEAIRRAVGCTEREWRRSWPLVERFWRVDGDDLVNDTQLAVYAEAMAIQERASERGRRGAQARALARAQAPTQAPAQAQPEQVPEGQPLSLSQIPDPSDRSPKDRARARTGSGVMAGMLPRDHLRHAWCGRVCVPEFIHADLVRALSTPDADAKLRAFYAETCDQLIEGAAPDPVKFWRAQAAAKWPAPDPTRAVSRRTLALMQSDAQFLSTGSDT